jgi:phage-related protein
MAVQDEWSIVFYLDDDGTSPVEEFLRGLDATTQRRFRWSIEQLRVRNVRAREPLVRHLDGKIWELREESQTNIYRIALLLFHGPADCLPAWVSEEDAEDIAP